MTSSPSSPIENDLPVGEENRPIRGLAAQTVAGAMWTSAGEVAQIGLHAIVFIVLARLLDPEDFGIYTLAAVIIGFSRVFGEIGLGPSLVQRREIDNAHIRTVFTSTLILSLATALAVLALAPFLASLMESPKLAPVIQSLSILFLLRGMGLVAGFLLQRDLRLSELARTSVISYLVGYGLVGISLAFAGLGYWALVAAALVQAGMQNVQFLILRPHTKSLGIYWPALKDLLSFGVGASAGRLGHYMAMKGDYIVVGRLLGMAPLGIYNRAYELMAIPANLCQTVANKAFFSAVAKVQNDKKRLARAHSRAAAVTALLLLPTGIALTILAPEVIEVVLGSKWMAVVAPFQIMALGMFFRSGYSVSTAVAKGTGDVHRLAVRQWVFGALVVVGAWAGHVYGITGVAVGVMLALIANFVMLSHLGLQSSKLSLQDFTAAHVPALTLGSIVLVGVSLSAHTMRSLGSPAILTLLVSASFTLGATALLVRRFPAIVGPCGLWVLESIRRLVPSGGALSFLKAGCSQAVKTSATS